MKNQIYFKKEWLDMLNEFPDDIKKNVLFNLIDYIVNNNVNEIESKKEKFIFNYIKNIYDRMKKNLNKKYFYIIECYCIDTKEHFLKYGTTNQEDISDRFNYYKSTMPYSYCLLDTFEKNDKFNPTEFEKKLKKLNLEKHIPFKKFGGYTECLNRSEYNTLIKLINY